MKNITHAMQGIITNYSRPSRDSCWVLDFIPFKGAKFDILNIHLLLKDHTRDFRKHV